MDCKEFKSILRTKLWDYLEGVMDKAVSDPIDSHSRLCNKCTAHLGTRIDWAISKDKQRVDRAFNETMNIRRAELLYLSESKGVELDLSTITTPNDYFRAKIGLIMDPPERERFYDFWDTADNQERADFLREVFRSDT